MNFKGFVQMTLVYIVSLVVRYIYFPVMRCYWKFFDNDSDSGYGPFVEYTSDDFIEHPRCISDEPSKCVSKKTSVDNAENSAKDISNESSNDELWIIEKEDSFECLKRASKDGSPTSSED